MGVIISIIVQASSYCNSYYYARTANAYTFIIMFYTEPNKKHIEASNLWSKQTNYPTCE